MYMAISCHGQHETEQKCARTLSKQAVSMGCVFVVHAGPEDIPSHKWILGPRFLLTWLNQIIDDCVPGRSEKAEESVLSDQSPLSSGVDSGQQSPVSPENRKTHRGIKKLWGK